MASKKLKTPLKTPKELHDITLRLEHVSMRNQPEEMLLSLYGYTKAYRQFVELVGEQVEPDSLAVFQLDCVEKGSVKLKNKVGYKPNLIDFIGMQLFKLLHNDVSDENFEEKAVELEKDTADFIEKSEASQPCFDGVRREPYFDRVTLAEVMQGMSDSGKLLMPKEHFEIVTPSEGDETNVVKFSRSFRSTVSISELKKVKPEKHDGEDTIIALRPCNVGTSSWYVQSVITKRKFYVRITDVDWLTRYQQGKMPVVRANDLINVNLKCDVVATNTGLSRNVNAEIDKVYSVEKGKHLIIDQQANLFE
ncbi:hypothetical protein [Vibrio harveyi]|uniref:hypothetical protein n=1 Tax=Vibrio harveyi TaxID=669 RepID=UPI0003465FAE|nr:hypothetical protein [Vibrio harveyi]